MMPGLKGTILIIFFLTSGNLYASAFTGHYNRCLGYKKLINTVHGPNPDLNGLKALATRKHCPSMDTAMLDLCIRCYENRDFACSMALAGKIRDSGLKPIALLYQTKSAFALGLLKTALDKATQLEGTGLAELGLRLKLRILCRMDRCEQGVRHVLSRLAVCKGTNLFRIRLLLIQAFMELHQKDRAINLAEYLFFNSSGKQETAALAKLALIDPMIARKDRILKGIFRAKRPLKFIRRHYHDIRKYPVLTKVAHVLIHGTGGQGNEWPVRYALAIKAYRNNDDSLLKGLVTAKWFPLMPQVIDHLSTNGCKLLKQNDIIGLLHNIPPEMGFGQWARLGFAICMWRKAKIKFAAKLLKPIVPTNNGLVYGLDEKILSLWALTTYKLGKKQEAITAWKRLSMAWPYTHYAALALYRLRLVSGTKVNPFKDGLSVYGKTGLELVRLGHPYQALEVLISLKDAGLLQADDTHVLGYLMNKYQGLRANLKNILRGRPHRQVRRFFRMAWPRAYYKLIGKASKRVGLSLGLITATARAESRFKPWALSGSGAYGLMQIQRHTARLVATRILKRPAMARSLFYPWNNLLLGGHYLKLLIEHFNGYLPLALVAYNAGLSMAHTIFQKAQNLPTEVFTMGLRPKIVQYYVVQILDMTCAYEFLYGPHRMPSCFGTKVPSDLVPFSIKLSIQ